MSGQRRAESQKAYPIKHHGYDSIRIDGGLVTTKLCDFAHNGDEPANKAVQIRSCNARRGKFGHLGGYRFKLPL